MKKVELVEAVAEETGLTKADATRASWFWNICSI